MRFDFQRQTTKIENVNSFLGHKREAQT